MHTAGVGEDVNEAFLEVLLGGGPRPVVPIRGRDELLSLGCYHRPEQLGVDAPQRLTKPYIEEVGQVSVANVVVIRWIGRDYGSERTRVSCIFKRHCSFGNWP